MHHQSVMKVKCNAIHNKCSKNHLGTSNVIHVLNSPLSGIGNVSPISSKTRAVLTSRRRL